MSQIRGKSCERFPPPLPGNLSIASFLLEIKHSPIIHFGKVGVNVQSNQLKRFPESRHCENYPYGATTFVCF